jgi:hydrophobe/amphiphile efflux-1 (HAE1) family protein
MNIVKISVQRPVFAWIVMSALIIFGGISFLRLGISQMPDVDFPILTISVIYDGASPEVIEAEIIDKFEQRLNALEGLKEIKASARSGNASLQLEFEIDKNIDVALQEVQTVISQIRLPAAVLDAPIIRKSNPEEDPIMFLGFWSDSPLKEVIEYLEFTVLPGLQSINGVGEVSIAGFSARNLRIWVDIKKLSQFEFTISDILDSVTQQHTELPVGLVSDKKIELNARMMGEAQTVEQFENLPILRRGGQVVVDKIFKIKDFARVEDGLSDIRRIAEVDGKNAVSLLVRKQRGTNEVEIAKKVRKYFQEISQSLPKGYQARINVDYTKSTEAVVNSTIQKLLLAGLVTIIIVFFFLGSLSSSFNILLSIPTSVIGTFTVMYFAGFTLNLFSLLALALVISIVIDDAIMVLENIIRHFRMGKTAFDAALDGTNEVLGATIAATLAVIAVFIPVVFMDGVIGKFFFQFGVVMSVAVLLSLVDAVTITPMRASQILSYQKKSSNFEIKVDHFFELLADVYKKSLSIALQAPILVLILATLFFGSSLIFFNKVKKEFVPPQDQNFLIMSFQTALDSSLEETHAKGKEVAEVIKSIPEIMGYFVSVGPGGQSTAANQGFVPLILKDQSERALSHLEIMNLVREKLKPIKGIKVQIRDVSARGLTSGRTFPVSFNLRGPDLDILEAKANEIIKALEERGIARDLDTDYKKGIREIQFFPKREVMAARGVSMDMISRTLQALVGGSIAGQFTQSGRRFDIRVKSEEGTIQSVKDIEQIYVRNIVGNLEPLSALVTAKEVPVTQSINRINRQRAVSVFGSLAEGASQSQVLDEAREVAKSLLPAGYQFALEGAASQLTESFKGIGFALLLGLLVAYMVLAVQYNSFVHPITVLAALPFAISGALIAIWVANDSLNLFSLIGIIVLMGIAKKNSILLVEFTNQTRERLPDIKIADALIEACPIRLRPILMTSFATLFAALPLMFKQGMGKEPTMSMAITIIGGILVSTILTLYVIPALYLILSRLESKRKIILHT